ncbi:MAG: hypothetical protein HKN10_01830 [Myxococcales bacterium]|nr:hypothetical protein [Myxococcales bacterium]
MNKISRLWLLVAALSIAVACSSGDDEGGGGEGSAVGQQMSELGDLGAQFIEANQATYDTLAQSSELIGAAFAGGVSAPSTALKQAGCLPVELAGQTLLVDVQSNTFTPTDPRGPSDAVQFVLLSDPQTEVGYVNLTCSGVLPSAITVNITVNTTDGTEVLALTASNISVSPPSSFSASLTGTLSSSGGDSVQFGSFGFEGGSSVFVDEFNRFTSSAFLVGDGITASVSQDATSDPSFASENIRLNVQGAPNFDPESICPSSFFYSGSMMGTPGDVSGGAFFCAPPPLADGFNYFVNCFDGSIEDMVVSAATAACIDMAGIFEGEPTQVGGAVLQDIRDGTNALLGMHNTVIAVAEAGGEVALKLAEAAQQQF